MKVQTFANEEQWLDARLGKITGTRLKDLVSKTGAKKIGFYEVIAERIAIPASDELAMDRGKRLEEEACARFAKETGKKVKNDLVLWMRDDDPNIALSPDGTIGATEAVECKCLSSARHLEAWVTKQVPNEYEYQVLQYFIVNEKLRTLYFVFYDPRMPNDFFYLTRTRKEMQDDIECYLNLERRALEEIAEIESQLTF